MRQLVVSGAALLLLVGGVVGAVWRASATPPHVATPATSDAVSVYIDPATGKPAEPPPDWAPPDAHAGARARAALPAPMIGTPNPAGGVTVDLSDRSTEQLRAVVGPDGRVHLECTDGTHVGHGEE